MCSRASLWNTFIYVCCPITTSSFLALSHVKKERDFVHLDKLWNMLMKKAFLLFKVAVELLSVFPFCKEWTAFRRVALFHRSDNTKQPLHSIRNHPRLCWEANRISFLLCFHCESHLSSPNTCSKSLPRHSPPVKDMHGNDTRTRNRLFPPLSAISISLVCNEQISTDSWFDRLIFRGNTDNY